MADQGRLNNKKRLWIVLKSVYSFLGRLEVSAATAQRVLEGLLTEVKYWYWRADTAQGKLISSGKQIIRDTERFQISLPGKFDWWGKIWT